MHRLQSSFLVGPMKYSNIGFLGAGYDVFRGNPCSSEGIPDPGFKSASVFNLTYNLNMTTADGKHLIPDNTATADTTACVFEFDVQIIHDAASYRQWLDEDANLDVTGFGARFSASIDFQTVSQHTEHYREQFFFTVTDCVTYQATLYPGITNLSDQFLSFVSKLPSVVGEKSNTSYSQFIDTYGTHFAKQVSMGGQFGYLSLFNTSSVVNMVSSQFDMSAMAGYSADYAIHGSSDKTINQTLVKRFNEARLEVTVLYSGGSPPQKVSDWNVTQWYNSVQKNAIPVRIDLERLSSLFTEVYFPGDKNIKEKQSLLESAITTYCDSMSLSYCQSDPPEPLPGIPNFQASEMKPTVTFPHSSKSFFWIPTLRDPSYRVMGTLLSCHGFPATISSLVLDGRNAPTETVQEATSWYNDTVCISYNVSSTPIKKCFVVKRPLCKENFTSIGDFAIEENEDLPPNLPCISKRCVVPCSKAQCSLTDSIQGITNGFPQFGENCQSTLLSFFRYNTSDPLLYNCLTTACLQRY